MQFLGGFFSGHSSALSVLFEVWWLVVITTWAATWAIVGVAHLESDGFLDQMDIAVRVFMILTAPVVAFLLSGVHTLMLILAKSYDQYILMLVLEDATLVSALRQFNALTAMQKDLNEEISRPLTCMFLTLLIWVLAWVIELLNGFETGNPEWLPHVTSACLVYGVGTFLKLMLSTSKKAEMLPHAVKHLSFSCGTSGTPAHCTVVSYMLQVRSTFNIMGFPVTQTTCGRFLWVVCAGAGYLVFSARGGVDGIW